MIRSSSYRPQSFRGSMFRGDTTHEMEEHPEDKPPFFNKNEKQGITKNSQQPFFQAKLNIGQPNDKYEQEADNVANKVVNNKNAAPVIQQKEISGIQRLATPVEDEKLGTNDARMQKDKEIQEKPEIQRLATPVEDEKLGTNDARMQKDKEIQEKPEIQRACAGCEQEEKEGGTVQKSSAAEGMEDKEKEKPGAVQRKGETTSSTTASHSLSNRVESSSGKGSSLPAKTLAEMSTSFGTDFSHVKVHTGSEAVGMNKELSAQAFTHGSDIYFNSGKFDPESSSGKHLLAHELTHVVQQDNPDLIQKKAKPLTAATTCHGLTAKKAPSRNDLVIFLIGTGIISGTGDSREFNSILLRHIAAKSKKGDEYLDYLLKNAYPMQMKCLTHNGNEWDVLFPQIVSMYGLSTPKQRAMRLINKEIRDHDRVNMVLRNDAEFYPSPAYTLDPAAVLLTPKSLRRTKAGSILSVESPEASILQKHTDDFLATLTLTEDQVIATTLPVVKTGKKLTDDAFQYGTPKAEDTVGDANRFDNAVVYWVNYYNQLLMPLDKTGKADPLNPDLVKAMIWRESRFDDQLKSKESTAFGLTQILKAERETEIPELTAGIAGTSKTKAIDEKKFKNNPTLQIALGVRHLFDKHGRSKDWEIAIRDYNGSKNKESYMKGVIKQFDSHKRK
jgi:Domain of unknown function (DUF4157)/Transglycosylase SLT domain